MPDPHAVDLPVQSRTMSAVATPSPFGDAARAEVTVAVRDGTLVLTDGDRSTTVRPSRVVMGHGTLHVTAAVPPSRLTLTFEQYAPPKPVRQHRALLGQLYRRLDAAGFRDILVALRDNGVPLATAPKLRHGAGIYRVTAWIGASTLLFVELALFGVPAGAISALAAGNYTTPSAAVTVALLAGLVAFLLLAIATSPIPLVVRQSFREGAARDAVTYLDTWAGRPPEQAGLTTGERLTFVPGVPLWPAVVLVLACTFYVLRMHVTLATQWTRPPVEPGPLEVPVPAWWDGAALSLAGYAGMALLLVIFGVSVLQWRRAPELHSIRWAPLVGALLCLAFGQGSADMSLTSTEQWLYLVIIVMIVAFTCGRFALGFGVFAALVMLMLLATFGFFDRWDAIVLLLPALVLLAAIAVRYLPGGARWVPLPADRAARMRRVVGGLWAGTVALGIGLAVAATRLIENSAGHF
jgi:hypothetical protein